jgi:hypothetical protein
VIRDIRGWIERKEGLSTGLHGAWFFTGGQWITPTADLAVQSVVGSGLENAPEFWALRYDHECRDTTFRRWRTDIGLTRQVDGAVCFRLRLLHYLRPGFVGDEPEAPDFTSPLIVKNLLVVDDKLQAKFLDDKIWISLSESIKNRVRTTSVATQTPDPDSGVVGSPPTDAAVFAKATVINRAIQSCRDFA